jgi:hypothetical protein
VLVIRGNFTIRVELVESTIPDDDVDDIGFGRIPKPSKKALRNSDRDAEGNLSIVDPTSGTHARNDLEVGLPVVISPVSGIVNVTTEEDELYSFVGVCVQINIFEFDFHFVDA